MGPERIKDVDALRGFALLGIFLVNILIFADPYNVVGGHPDQGALDSAGGWLVAAFFAGKFYVIFSFLFGYSFTLQLRSARTGAKARILRRLAGLFVLGLLHGLFLFAGDILMTYALMGLVLFFARDTAPRKVVVIGAWLWAVWSALLLSIAALTYFEPSTRAELVEDIPEMISAYRGDARSVINENAHQLLIYLLPSVLFIGGLLAGAFLMGLAAGKLRLLAQPVDPRHRSRLVKIMIIGLVFGLPGAIASATAQQAGQDDAWSDLAGIFGLVTAPALSATYVCGMLLLLHGKYGTRIANALAPAGRMSLTNYLGQSVVMALVFTAYGFGLYGRVGVATLIAGAVAFYVLQLVVSAWLMRRFRYGPAEWLLRAMTRATFHPSKEASSV